MRRRATRGPAAAMLAFLWAGIASAWARAVRSGTSAGPPDDCIRSRQQSLHVHGSPQGAPVIVSSGDGGWMHRVLTFSAAALVHRVAPLTLAAIHATHEFVPLRGVERVVGAAREPRRLWIVNASNRRFSDNLAGSDGALFEAVAWVDAHRPE